MIRLRVLFLLLFALFLSGCSHISEKRITHFKERCALIGFPIGSTGNARCVLELEKSRLENTNTFGVPNNSSAENDVQRMIDQDRIEKQILRHGAGGCTPDFATGGCL